MAYKVIGEGENESESVTYSPFRQDQDKTMYITRSDTLSPSSSLSPLSPSPLSPSSSFSSSPPTPLNIVYHTTVPISQKIYFEKEWLPEMARLYIPLKGFRHRSVNLLIQTQTVCEYLVIISCDDYESYLELDSSPPRVLLLNQLKLHHITTRRLDTTYENPSSDSESTIQHPSKAFLKDSLGKSNQLLPPPKWKLCLIIYVGVMMNIFLWSYSGIPLAMALLNMPQGFILFVSLAFSVPILSYAFFPLVMSVPQISKWLRAPRPAKMSSIHKLLDSGLLMFAAKMTPMSKEIITHFKKLEQRLEATRKIQHQLTTEIHSLKEQLKDVEANIPQSVVRSTKKNEPDPGDRIHDNVRQAVTGKIQNLSKKSPSKKKIDGTVSLLDDQTTDLEIGGMIEDEDDVIESGHQGPLTVAVAHWVKWEHILDFELWTEEITAEMAKFDGFLGMTTIVPKSEHEPYINCFTYDKPENLMKFIDSENRRKLLRKLTPYLDNVSQAQTLELQDAFTELFVSTGECADSRPPPIWKSVILTLIPLHIIVWQLGGNFVKILVGEAKLEINVALTISTVMTVVVNSYIGLPIMQSQFGEWLRYDRTIDENDPLKFLDVGFSRRGQLFVLFLWIFFTVLCGSLNLIQPKN